MWFLISNGFCNSLCVVFFLLTFIAFSIHLMLVNIFNEQSFNEVFEFVCQFIYFKIEIFRHKFSTHPYPQAIVNILK